MNAILPVLTHSDYCGDFQYGSENKAVSALIDRFYRKLVVKTRNNHYQRVRGSHTSKILVACLQNSWHGYRYSARCHMLQTEDTVSIATTIFSFSLPNQSLNVGAILPLVSANTDDRPTASAFRDDQRVGWRMLYDDISAPSWPTTPLADDRSSFSHFSVPH